jgi:hypothetical protein
MCVAESTPIAIWLTGQGRPPLKEAPNPSDSLSEILPMAAQCWLSDMGSEG